MTLIERSPNMIFAPRTVGKFFAKQDLNREEAEDVVEASDNVAEDVNDAPASDAGDEVMTFGDQASAYRLTKLIAAADEADAKIIGIVGARHGVGASVSSRQLAGAYASFGRTTLLVNASAAPRLLDATTSGSNTSVLEPADEVRPSLSYIELAGDAEITAQDFAGALKSAAQSGQTIIVDLPPIVGEDGLPNTALRDLGTACDLVFLVCLTGEMRRKELSECVETCKVVGVELNGLILNDWQLPASRLLES